MRTRIISRWVRLCGLLAVSWICTGADLPGHVFIAYHDSWNEWPASIPEQTSLANLPGYIDVVALAFAKPDAAYRGDLNIAGSGLEYQMPGPVLRDAVSLLKRAHRNTRVVLSVGGATYRRWDRIALSSIVGLVRDLGLDGVDIDFEPADPRCQASSDGRITCATDHAWNGIVQQMRAAFPRPMLVTTSVWSVGAYGETNFLKSMPRTAYTGMMMPLLRGERALDLDLLSINAYDAGPPFDPLESFRAYRAVWPGRLALGVETHRKEGIGPFYSTTEIEELAAAVAKDTLGGMMLYSLLAMPDGGPRTSPTGSDIAQAICRGLTALACDRPIP